MTNSTELVKRLRNPPNASWAELMEQAADALEASERELEKQRQRMAMHLGLAAGVSWNAIASYAASRELKAQEAEASERRVQELERHIEHHSGLLNKAGREQYNRAEAAERDAAEWAKAWTEAERRAQWQPIETAPKDGTVIIGALIRDGKAWRVQEMEHNGLAFYTAGGGSLPQMTHWMPLPELKP